ncbi:hypothetical protein [Actinomadura sp. WMMA1423]|uniref:PASTA domain-containing protein n=1 Tax=Actinomadura sp. WMMA1423 TaxID=2591108 RepID=UPI001147685B|nr:hypothetical protein [Actinomadura sp. WMMA1423]
MPGPIVAVIAVSCLGVGMLGGCAAGIGISGSGEPAAARQESTTPAAAETPTTRAAAPSTPKASHAPPGVPSAASPSKSPAKVRVPNVVGHNHQTAQNEMQAAGFFMLAEEDATGQGRMLLWDRNWVVVRQSPRAGTKASPESTVTLYSKKIGE